MRPHYIFRHAPHRYEDLDYCYSLFSTTLPGMSIPIVQKEEDRSYTNKGIEVSTDLRKWGHVKVKLTKVLSAPTLSIPPVSFKVNIQKYRFNSYCMWPLSPYLPSSQPVIVPYVCTFPKFQSFLHSSHLLIQICILFLQQEPNSWRVYHSS